MQKQRTTWAYLPILAVLANCGLSTFAGGRGDQKDPPKPPPEIIKAWQDAGAKFASMKMNLFADLRIQDKGEVEAVPAFGFSVWKEGVLPRLPVPETAFGLSLAFTQIADGGLKELAGLKNLQALDLSGTKVTDAGLKELAELKHLQSLNLFGTQVTDAGLKELAGLKNLQFLQLERTKVTASGVAALRKELPACRILH